MHVTFGCIVGGNNSNDLRSVADLDRMIAQSMRDDIVVDDDDLSDTDDPDLLVGLSSCSLILPKRVMCEHSYWFWCKVACAKSWHGS